MVVVEGSRGFGRRRRDFWRNRSRRAPNGRHDKTTQKNQIAAGGFRCPTKNAPRSGALFAAAVFFGAVLFFFGGGGGDATIEESEVRARPNAEEDGGRPTNDEVYWRDLRPEVRKISSFIWRAKRSTTSTLVYVHPPVLFLCSRARCVTF